MHAVFNIHPISTPRFFNFLAVNYLYLHQVLKSGLLSLWNIYLILMTCKICYAYWPSLYLQCSSCALFYHLLVNFKNLIKNTIRLWWLILKMCIPKQRKENLYCYFYSFFHYKINENLLWLMAWTFVGTLIFISRLFVLILLLMVSLYQDFMLSWFCCCCCFDLLDFSFFLHIEGILLLIPPLQYLLYYMSCGDIPWSWGIVSNAHMTNIVFTWIYLRGPSHSPFMNVLHPWCVQTWQFTFIKPFCDTEILLTFYNGTENEPAY